MSYDIVLVMLPPWEPKRAPLGLAYISEYLRFKGFKPKVLDFNIDLYRAVPFDKRIYWEIPNINSMPINEIAYKMFNSFRDEIDGLVNQIISLDCDLVGFYHYCWEKITQKFTQLLILRHAFVLLEHFRKFIGIVTMYSHFFKSTIREF